MRKAELAWETGDAPDNPDFAAPVDGRLAETILAAAEDITGAESVTALRRTDSAVGRYRLRAKSGDWFVRISERQGHPALETAIAAFLDRKGVPVARPRVAGAPFGWEGQVYRLDIREMIPARHFNGSAADIARLTGTIGKCHAVLKEFPNAEDVRKLSAERFDRIETLRTRLLEMTDDFGFLGTAAAWADQHRGWIEEALSRFRADFAAREGAQTIHGEIHPGNILFRETDGEAVLIDFEESPVSYAPPAWDLAYLKQRFAAPVSTTESLSAMMRDIPALLFCIAGGLALDDGIETPLSEYEKFYRLDQAALS